MKKIITILLVAAMVCSLAACGKNKGGDGSASASPVEVLTKAWDSFDESDKFSVFGGDFDNAVDGAPGEFSIKDAEALDASLGFPSNSVALLNSAASLSHAMNANTFTAGAFRVNDANEVEMLASDIQENIMGRQWLCGFPETLLIVQVGEDTLVSAFGLDQNIQNLKSGLTENFKDCKVICEESLDR